MKSRNGDCIQGKRDLIRINVVKGLDLLGSACIQGKEKTNIKTTISFTDVPVSAANEHHVSTV